MSVDLGELALDAEHEYDVSYWDEARGVTASTPCLVCDEPRVEHYGW